MKTTLGGCAAMNVHGKNAYQMGTIGDHILEFEMLLPNGKLVTCSREQNSDLFHAAIGGFGMLGCFTSLHPPAQAHPLRLPAGRNLRPAQSGRHV
jgi:decaprenylphospho-beta-D-ribofuranose 2-oxidase